MRPRRLRASGQERDAVVRAQRWRNQRRERKEGGGGGGRECRTRSPDLSQEKYAPRNKTKNAKNTRSTESIVHRKTQKIPNTQTTDAARAPTTSMNEAPASIDPNNNRGYSGAWPLPGHTVRPRQLIGTLGAPNRACAPKQLPHCRAFSRRPIACVLISNTFPAVAQTLPYPSVPCPTLLYPSLPCSAPLYPTLLYPILPYPLNTLP